MNNPTREALNKIVSSLQEIQSQLEIFRDEEQEKYDNMPESLQGGERGEKAESAANALSSAVDSVESAISEIETASE